MNQLEDGIYHTLDGGCFEIVPNEDFEFSYSIKRKFPDGNEELLNLHADYHSIQFYCYLMSENFNRGYKAGKRS
jgi:hypothetical protein